MVYRGSFGGADGYGEPELVVADKVLRTSYDVVRYVAANIIEITAIKNNLNDILLLAPYLSDITVIGVNIEGIVTLSASVDAIDAVAASIDDINTVMANLADILSAKSSSQGSAAAAALSAAAANTSKNDAATIKAQLLADITASITLLASNASPTAVYDPNTKRITFGLPATPVNTLAVGTVVNAATAKATIRGTAPNQIVDFEFPTGAAAWTPTIANVTDGQRIVQRIIDWTGGSGVKPSTGLYIGPTGLVGDITAATNIRGAGGSGTGDMLASIYDPTAKGGDAFSMTNMAEGTTNKILTSTERTKLAGIAIAATANATDAQLRDRTTHTGVQATSTITGLDSALAALTANTEKLANKGAANGYASLGSDSKVPVAQLPDSIVGSVKYQSAWNASTNSPVIPVAGAANKGWYYVITTAGATTIDGISDWKVGDWIISNGTAWEKVDSSDQVNSVNGKQGVVVISASDVGLGNVANKTEAQLVASGAVSDAINARATSSQGSKADTAVQPASLKNGATTQIYTGTVAPTSAFGNDSDIFLRYDA